MADKQEEMTSRSKDCRGRGGTGKSIEVKEKTESHNSFRIPCVDDMYDNQKKTTKKSTSDTCFT